MPQNKNLEPVRLPMKLKFDEAPSTQFFNNLEALKIELVDHPSREQALSVAWNYTKATWADHPDDTDYRNSKSRLDLSTNLEDVMCFKALPTPMECLGFTFKLSGLSFQEVTHIIRHRAGSFAAQCTGDRDLRHDSAVVPESVQNSPAFYKRWLDHVQDGKDLYAEMNDSKVISMMDSRMILPKCLTSFYLMRLNLKDLLGFIKQRQDKQIQPAADNMLAAYMARELISVLPEASVAINFDAQDRHYINTFRVKEGDGFTSRGTNLYWPEPKNDTFEYHPDDTIYQARREELNGTDPENTTTVFDKLWDNTLDEISHMTAEYNNWKERSELK